jgi:hypothetical protein
VAASHSRLVGTAALLLERVRLCPAQSLELVGLRQRLASSNPDPKE